MTPLHPEGRSDEAVVSVIVPARNAADWIATALESVVCQTHRALEILVVDNGSTDATRERVAELQRRHASIRLIDEPIAGPSAARNAGLDAATGDFIQFLDADDALRPDKLATQLCLLKETGGDVAWGPFERTRADAGNILDGTGTVVTPALDDDVQAGLIAPGGFLHLGAALIRRAAIGPLRFDTRVRVVEDVRFLFALARAGARFIRQEGRSGYVMREHSHAGRASRVAASEFADSCTDLAGAAEAAWAAEGTLTDARRLVLAQIHVSVAGPLVRIDGARSRAALARARALTPRYYEAFPRDWRALVRTIGFERAERVAGVVRRIRDAMGWRTA